MLFSTLIVCVCRRFPPKDYYVECVLTRVCVVCRAISHESALSSLSFSESERKGVPAHLTRKRRLTESFPFHLLLPLMFIGIMYIHTHITRVCSAHCCCVAAVVDGSLAEFLLEAAEGERALR